MPPTQSDPRTQVSNISLKINGQPVPPDVLAKVIEVTIEQDLVLPDTFSVRFHDMASQGLAGAQTLFPLADRDDFRIGKEVELAMGREDTAQSALKGEITSIDLEIRADGSPLLTIRGYDKAHRLNRQKHTRVFKNVKTSNIVQQVAQQYGLQAQVEQTQVVYPHVVQDNQTDWELVRSLARMVGKEAYIRDNALEFKAPAAASAPVDLEFGVTLRHLRLRMSATSQVSEVEVRGWDPDTKRPVTGSANRPADTSPNDAGRAGGQSASVLGTGKYILNDSVVRTAQEATQRAQSILDEIAGSFVTLECLALGSPELRPGRQIKLKGVSNRFVDPYYISAAKHQMTPDRGYLTSVVVSGKQPNSLTALVSGNGARAGAPAASKAGVAHPSVVVGIVTNNKDPEMGGRVKVKFPWFDDSVESDWARIAAPMGGNDRGFFWLPEVDDEVLVGFEHGDINRPFVLGGLWNGRDKPPKTANEVVGADGKVNQRVIKSRSGHTITIDDTASQENITIVDKTGNNTIKLESPMNKLTLKVNGDMVLEALQGTISIKGMAVLVEATQGLNLKGTTADVQATAKLGLNGGGMTEVKGGVVKLN